MEDQNQEQMPEMQEEKIISLRKPVEFAKVRYEQLQLREPTAGELSKATKAGDNVDTAISLISQITKVPRGAVELLCQRDFQEANDFLGSFTIDGRQTGETS